MEESDEDVADTDVGKGNADDEGEEDEIVESDIELEGETLEPDNDPPQKVLFFSALNLNYILIPPCYFFVGCFCIQAIYG